MRRRGDSWLRGPPAGVFQRGQLRRFKVVPLAGRVARDYNSSRTGNASPRDEIRVAWGGADSPDQAGAARFFWARLVSLAEIDAPPRSCGRLVAAGRGIPSLCSRYLFPLGVPTALFGKEAFERRWNSELEYPEKQEIYRNLQGSARRIFCRSPQLTLLGGTCKFSGLEE